MASERRTSSSTPIIAPAKIKHLHGAISGVEGDNKATHQHHTVIPSSWPDWWFKRLHRQTKVGSLQNIAEVVNTSTECNVAQLDSREDGTTIVQTLDWTDFFATELKIQGIRVSSSSPGHVLVKERSHTVERDKEPWTQATNAKPDAVPPKGLNADR